MRAEKGCDTGELRPVINKPSGAAEFFAVGGGLCPQSTPTAPVTVGTLHLRGIVLDNKQISRGLWIRNAVQVRARPASHMAHNARQVKGNRPRKQPRGCFDRLQTRGNDSTSRFPTPRVPGAPK